MYHRRPRETTYLKSFLVRFGSGSTMRDRLESIGSLPAAIWGGTNECTSRGVGFGGE
jgi:hypothetical protein